MESAGAGGSSKRAETRIGRGWRLSTTAWRMTWRSRTVLLLAVIAAACGVVALGAALFVAAGNFPGHHSVHTHLVGAAILALYPFTFLVVFLDVAMAAAAGAGFEGSRLSLREALRVPHSRAGGVALWAAATAAVTILLRLLGADLPGVASTAILALDLLWVLTTIFVIPLLALTDAGPRQLVRDSRALLSRSWGEDLTGIILIGVLAVAMLLPWLTVLLVGIALVVLIPSGGGLVVIGIATLGILAARALAGALQQVFAVALYRYAAAIA